MLLKIIARWFLKDSQIKLRGHGIKVIKNIGLNTFIGIPLFVRAEAVDLNRNATPLGIQLADEKSHLLIDVWVGLEITLDVGAKGADIGKASAVHSVIETGLPDF